MSVRPPHADFGGCHSSPGLAGACRSALLPVAAPALCRACQRSAVVLYSHAQRTLCAAGDTQPWRRWQLVRSGSCEGGAAAPRWLRSGLPSLPPARRRRCSPRRRCPPQVWGSSAPARGGNQACMPALSAPALNGCWQLVVEQARHAPGRRAGCACTAQACAAAAEVYMGASEAWPTGCAPGLPPEVAWLPTAFPCATAPPGRADWAIPSADIELLKQPDGSYCVLGEGRFGRVFKGLKGGVTVRTGPPSTCERPHLPEHSGGSLSSRRRLPLAAGPLLHGPHASLLSGSVPTLLLPAIAQPAY